MSDPYVLAVGLDGPVTRFEGVNGAVAWTTDRVRGACTPLPAAGGISYVGTFDGTVAVIEDSNGQVVHQVKLLPPAAEGDGSAVLGVAGSGDLLFAIAGDYLFGFDPGADAPLWSYQMGNKAWGGPVVAEHVVLSGSWDGAVHAVGADGTPAWTATYASFPSCEPAILGDVVYVTGDDRHLGLDLATGEVLWAEQAGQGPFASPHAIHRRAGRFYAAGPARVEARSLADGSLEWEAAVEKWPGPVAIGRGDEVTPVPDQDPNGHVFVANIDGNIYALHKEDGSLTWQAPLGGAGLPPAVVHA